MECSWARIRNTPESCCLERLRIQHFSPGAPWSGGESVESADWSGGAHEVLGKRESGLAFECGPRQCDRDPPKLNTMPQMSAKLRMVMRNLHFEDVWREMYPTSRIFSCYTPTHGAYSRLDRFLLANDGSLDVCRVAYQVWFLSDHTPLLLECETHVPKPVIPLWRLRPDLLGDPEYKQDVQGALNGYFSTNWGTATAIKLETLKIVIRGESLNKTYGIRKHLDQELTRQEDVLTALQRQIDNRRALREGDSYEHTAPAALVVLDMEKAFDLLSWEYLWEVMRRMGIGPDFLSWVRLLYTVPRARVRTGPIVS
ncbi:hypothetical protein NDU88_003012 [Pleurodeles waltl]|uniref:Reverse transcriptase domain-containing protein n=1 Tax=Pleurodeles waltl TaxID=8319 RepID=A0AAV7KX88_PLEWA|nr:hypothetical protein NDU88_003012 [Pleurodeles waltl]